MSQEAEFCPTCGTGRVPGARFCVTCGADLGAFDAATGMPFAGSDTSASGEGSKEDRRTESPGPEGGLPTSRPPRRARGRVLFGLGLLAGAVGIGLIAFAMLNPGVSACLSGASRASGTSRFTFTVLATGGHPVSSQDADVVASIVAARLNTVCLQPSGVQRIGTNQFNVDANSIQPQLEGLLIGETGKTLIVPMNGTQQELVGHPPASVEVSIPGTLVASVSLTAGSDRMLAIVLTMRAPAIASVRDFAQSGLGNVLGVVVDGQVVAVVPMPSSSFTGELPPFSVGPSAQTKNDYTRTLYAVLKSGALPFEVRYGPAGP